MSLIQYRFAGHSRAIYPGAHKSRAQGDGLLFKHHQPLMAYPDPRRIDLRASVLDMFEQYQVRISEQNRLIDVVLIVDLSASMQPQQAFITAFCHTLAESALAYGDTFSFYGVGQGEEPSLRLVKTKQIGLIDELFRREAISWAKQTPNWLALLPFLPKRPALIFLLSDFYFALDELKPLLALLPQHDVVPLALSRSADYEGLPDWGLWHVQDRETQQQKTLLLYPGFNKKLRNAMQVRREHVRRFFSGFGAEALFLQNRFKPEYITEYFLQRQPL